MEDTRSFEDPHKKKRNRATPEQVAVLESFFYSTPCPNSKQREDLASQISMPERSVQIWFQNRRAKMRNMQKQNQANMNMGGRMPIPRWRRNSTPYGMTSPLPPNMLQQMMYYKNMAQARDILLHVDTLVVGSQMIKQYHVWFNPGDNKIWIQMNVGDSKVIVHIPFPTQMEWMDDLEGLQQSPCSGIRLLTSTYQVTLEDMSTFDKPVMDEHGVTLVGGPSLHQQYLQMTNNGRRPSAVSMSSGMSPSVDRRMSLPFQQMNELIVTPPMQSPISSQPQIQIPQPGASDFFTSSRNRAMSAPSHQIQSNLQQLYGTESLFTPGTPPSNLHSQIPSPLAPSLDMRSISQNVEHEIEQAFMEVGREDPEPDFLTNLI